MSLATSTSSTKKTPVHSSPDFSSPEVAAAAVATVVVVVVAEAAEAAVVAVAEVAEAASALEVAVVVDRRMRPGLVGSSRAEGAVGCRLPLSNDAQLGGEPQPERVTPGLAGAKVLVGIGVRDNPARENYTAPTRRACDAIHSTAAVGIIGSTPSPNSDRPERSNTSSSLVQPGHESQDNQQQDCRDQAAEKDYASGIRMANRIRRHCYGTGRRLGAQAYPPIPILELFPSTIISFAPGSWIASCCMLSNWTPQQQIISEML